jgi:thimet oligopeptidase
MRPFMVFALAAVVGSFPIHAATPSLPADTGIAWNLTPTQVADTCATALSHAQSRIKAIDAQPLDKATFASGLGAVENTVADMQDALVAPNILSQIAVSKAVRDASTKCQEDIAAFGVKVNADPAIYALAKSAQAQATTQADKQLAKIYLENGRRAGAGLDAAKRAQVSALFDQLNNLQLAFGRALAEDHHSIEISQQEAASLPKDFVGALKAKGAGYTVDVNESTAQVFMSNEASAAARKRFLTTYFHRGGAANVQRLTEAVALRDRLAHLLGFHSWAAYQLSAKMAKTPATVDAFLTEVNSKLLPKARAEIAVLDQLKRASGDTTPFMPWDGSYYEKALVKSRYAVDDDVVRQYFPIDKVVPAMLDIYQKMLGVRFDAITPAQAWAPGVQEYAISDTASGKPIGWFFLDLYPRAGKFGHFATFPMRSGRVLADGSRQKPVAAIIGNWPVGTPGKPALLTHYQVITFFHEFGHLMHGTLSTAPYETLFGPGGVRGDFVEAPSQMLENWMWQPSVLKQISSHVGTGAPLPDALIAKMIAAKHVADGSMGAGQSFYAMYDMQLHSSGAKVDPTKLWFKLEPQLTPFSGIPGTIPEASFGHLMGGYDAGYYGYLWSKVYAQDMFSVFLKEGLDNPAVGMRYRKDILEPGGTVEPDVLLHNFLGRPVSYAPFYKEMGITP